MMRNWEININWERLKQGSEGGRGRESEPAVRAKAHGERKSSAKVRGF